jgi:hypothetical protein
MGSLGSLGSCSSTFCSCAKENDAPDATETKASVRNALGRKEGRKEGRIHEISLPVSSHRESADNFVFSITREWNEGQEKIR